MMREDRIRLRNKDAPIPPAGENGSGPVARRGSAAQAGRTPQSPESFLIFPISREGKSTKIKKKSATRRSRNSLERPTGWLVFPFCLF